MSAWRGLLIALVVISGAAVAAATPPAAAQVPESPGCALLNDPANGLDGVESAFQEIGPTDFNDGERILITMDDPSFGAVAGLRVLLGGTSNLDAAVAALPATIEVWGLGSVMRWETVADAGGDGAATVTWESECIPAPVISATVECRGESGVIVISVDDQSSTSYVFFIDDEEREPIVSDDGAVSSFEYEPFPDGDLEVVVEPLADRRIELLITQVTVACAASPPTTVTPPVTPTTQAVDVGATLPQTGGSAGASGWSIGLGLTFLVAGGLLLRVGRRSASVS